jgi:hypothetical protein
MTGKNLPPSGGRGRQGHDIGERHGAVKTLQHSLDGHIRHTAETVGELRSEQRRQANVLDEHGRQLTELHAEQQRQSVMLEQLNEMLTRVASRLDGQ